MMQLATVSGVPVNAQKLIYKGKQISADVESTLIQAGLSNGSKVMLLGKKYDPTQEAAYKDIVNLETKGLLVETKYLKLCQEMEDLEKGWLAKEHVPQAVSSLEKRANSNNEELHKILANLDTVTVEGNQTEIRNKRKVTATKVNLIMDKNDEFLERVREFKKKIQK